MQSVMTAKPAAAEYFNGAISYWKLLELAKTGQIPHVKVGYRVIFRREALDAWMKAQEQTPPVNKNEDTVNQLSICN